MYNVYVVYRQWKKSGWFGRASYGPKQVIYLYADETDAREFAKEFNRKFGADSRYIVEPWQLIYGWRLLQRELLNLLTEDGKRLLGIEE